MTQQHEIATDALASERYIQEVTDLHEQITWLRAEKRILSDVNKALSAENEHLTTLAEQRRLDLVKCRENMRGIRRHK